MIEEHEIIDRIKVMFDDNYEVMRLEGGHSITEDLKKLALDQVLYYYQKMRDVATKVTQTEVKLTLPDQLTAHGRRFTIEGVVDIVRDDEETWMYDIKTHDPEYVKANTEQYEGQLNVYAHIWQGLRGEPLDHTAVISTAYPESLKQATRANDLHRIHLELAKWKPLIEIPFSQEKVQETIKDFAVVVDKIEENEFRPQPAAIINSPMKGTTTLFGTRICGNCDARFSCPSFQQYATSKGRGERGSFMKYFEDYGSDSDQEEWVNANLGRTSSNILGGE